MKDTGKKVRYTIDLINVRGDVFGEEERIGVFINFTPDYEKVVIQGETGEIVHINYKKVRFVK